MSRILWSGLDEKDAVANYERWYKKADPNAKIEKKNGYWVIIGDSIITTREEILKK